MSTFQLPPQRSVNQSRRRSLSQFRPGKVLLSLMLIGSLAEAAPFVLDNAHTSVYFAASHFDRTLMRGRFKGITGHLDFDPAQRIGTLDFMIDPESVDTGLRGLDTVLKSSQFFDTKEYPLARFESTKMIFDGEHLRAVDGQLTLHGVTRPLQLQADRFSCGEIRLLTLRRFVCGGDFHATIQRSAFGMRGFLPDVSDAVRIDVAVEASPAG